MKHNRGHCRNCGNIEYFDGFVHPLSNIKCPKCGKYTMSGVFHPQPKIGAFEVKEE